MPYPARVKNFAYVLDPSCWESYSGMLPSLKRRMDARRLAALESSQRYISLIDELSFLIQRRTEVPMPPLKIAMMLHFAYRLDAFPENKTQAYVKFVRELLADEMIMRPTPEQRATYLQWAYTATDKGKVYVEALKHVPLPVQAKPQWVMP